jgi:hypothetical protein
MSPLAKKHRSKPGLVERFELMINGKEIANALYRLRAIYQIELEKSFPNKRTSVENLRTAQLAVLLMDWYHVDAATAMEAATGKRNRVGAKVVSRTLKNRRAKLYGDVFWPTPSEYDAAVERLQKAKTGVK